AQEMLSKSFLDFIHSDDREMALHELRNLKSQLLPTTSFECRCVKKDGGMVWFSWKISLVAENSAFYGVGRDITDRKQLEVENMLARQAALAANEAKSQFLANVSHEIRTPLHGVMGMTKLLLDTPLNAEQRENAENILTSSDNLLTVINDVLDLSKIEAGQMRIEKLDFNLSHLIADVINNTKNLAAQKNIKLVSIVPPVYSNVRGDAHRLRQVLLNLVSNAIKFTEKGSVKLVVESLAEPESDFGFKFSVQDTGIGLSDKTMKKLFKAFSQADSTTSRRYGGTGLGLSICKQLVELMGGHIGVNSIENEGSTFWFELSLEKAAQNSKSNSPSIALAGLKYEGRVLVADDTLINQKVIARTLQKMGLHVDVAENGVQVIEQLQKVPDYDIVFLDGHMPLLDGYDTAKKIRSDKSTLFHKVVLVALTANTLKGEREKCLALGMDEFLSKPINDDELHAILGRFLVTEKNSRRITAPVKVTPQKQPGQIIDMQMLGKLEYLQNEGEDDIIVELINSFLKETQPRLEKFDQYLRENQLQKLVDEA
ncbi:MAG: response regulator, partial [Bdellovibrionaceae bacterium]|nr:response regulator [Pseudobdellovibrionaceae bacterium]